MSDQFVEGKFGDGSKFYWQADTGRYLPGGHPQHRGRLPVSYKSAHAVHGVAGLCLTRRAQAHRILSDSKKLPLFFTSDIVIGETTMYADYIFPDLTYLERWDFAGSHPSVTCMVAPFRQPAAAPLTNTITVYGEQMPLSLESMILGLAEQMKLPGFGENAFGPGLHLSWVRGPVCWQLKNAASRPPALIYHPWQFLLAALNWQTLALMN